MIDGASCLSSTEEAFMMEFWQDKHHAFKTALCENVCSTLQYIGPGGKLIERGTDRDFRAICV